MQRAAVVAFWKWGNRLSNRIAIRRKLAASLIITALLLPTSALGAPQIQENPPIEDPEVLEIMGSMSAEQRVGQLFLVTFTGTDVSVDSDIGRLVREGRVGGVALSVSNDNFTDEEDLLVQVLQLTNDLQALATEEPPVLEGSETVAPSLLLEGPFIPLFIAIELDGEGYPSSQLLSGVTPLPANMALGATWDPTYAEVVGLVAGEELSALGINMVLGPTLDVLEEAPPTGGDLGVRPFGGDPYWVAQMSAPYVRGVHQGSNGRVAVVPSHFPGLGSADRPTDVEVSTVRRSLSQLVQVDLPPFFAVTGAADDPATRADGLLTGHIRYLGFQGDNPRLATRPISLDPQALQVLMEQPQVTTWRDEGGLLISGALGQRSIRRFYDPSENSFPNRRIAQDAFLAGNDVLYLADFGPSARGDQTETVVDTIDFFVQKYNEDPTFQARVDDAVARILRQKLNQYGEFAPGRMRRSEAGLASVGQQREVVVEVAQAGLTLLSPSQDELAGPPGEDDLIVIFTDTRMVTQCSTCEPRPVVPLTALRDTIVDLYGPGASDLVGPGSVQSYSFTALNDLLEFGSIVPEEVEPGTPTPEPNSVEIALDNTDWVVFVMLDLDPEVVGSNAVKRFLSERPDLAGDANIVVMAMDAPYYLDSTEISKLSAYYALYDSSEPFLNTAARALFQEVLPGGASPVTVNGIDYVLLEATSPDPTQIIELYAGDVPLDPASTPEPLRIAPGDELRVRTGVILDGNGNPVPDGTPVDFDINFVNEGLHTTETATTVGGVSQATLLLDRTGRIEVTAVSEPAQLSFTLVVDLPESGDGDVRAEPPEVTPTAPNPPATEPPDASVGVGGTPTPEVPLPPPPPGRQGVNFGDFLLTIVGLLGISGLAYRLGRRRGGGQVNDGLFYALPSLVGGLLAYNYYAFRVSDSEGYELFRVALSAWGGAIVGFAVAVASTLWRTLTRSRRG
jgi:beta-N-acetylhexosaminidase